MTGSAEVILKHTAPLPLVNARKRRLNFPKDRIIVFGDDPQAVRSVAEAIVKEAFHNVAFFAGNAADLGRAVK